MREYRNYIILLSSLLLLYAVYDYYTPKPVNWMSTYKVTDKNPFGTYILNERSEDLFTSKLETSYSTLSEMNSDKSILLLADNLIVDGADLIYLFELLDQGANVFIAANRYNQKLQDTLGIESIGRFEMMGSGVLIGEQVELVVANKTYEYPTPMLSGYFELDSATLWTNKGNTVFGSVAITRNYGEGQLTIVSSPYIFTNFGLLFNENYEAASTLLSILPSEPVHYSMFYQFGKPGASTPFRYFLSQPALKWSIYLGLFTIAIFLLIDSWRKQRAIPIVLPPSNASIKYVRTLGALFYREGNHYKAAMKLITHFFATIRERFLLEPEFTEKFYTNFSGKSGIKKSTVISAFELIAMARKTPHLDENTLVELSKKIDAFK